MPRNRRGAALALITLVQIDFEGVAKILDRCVYTRNTVFATMFATAHSAPLLKVVWSDCL